MMKGERASRCELALMGKVVEASNEEVQEMTNYILLAMGSTLEVDIQSRVLDNGCDVKYLVANLVEDMKCITFLLEYTGEDADDTPKPFEEDYGSGYPCAFCYVLNADVPEFSEYGDSFFEKLSDGYYHRKS